MKSILNAAAKEAAQRLNDKIEDLRNELRRFKLTLEVKQTKSKSWTIKEKTVPQGRLDALVKARAALAAKRKERGWKVSPATIAALVKARAALAAKRKAKAKA